MILKSLKLSKKSTETKPLEDAPERPAYPWGTEIRLEDELVDRLFGDELPDVETTMDMVARVTVSGASTSQSQGGAMRRSVSLQITDMAIRAEQVDPAEKLCGGKKG